MNANNIATGSDEVKRFFRQWNVYQKVIAHNYMLHQEVASFLSTALAGLGNRGLRILDLGCGDAAMIAGLGPALSIESYRGVDLSGPALDFARKNLESLDCDKRFVENNFLNEIMSLSGEYDVIIAGYSLHHLSQDEKILFFQRAHALLGEGGRVVIYDLVRRNDESRSQYLDRLCRYYGENWHQITAEELEAIFDHIKNSDYPEQEGFFEKMATQFNYSCHVTEFRDADRLYDFFYLEK